MVPGGRGGRSGEEGFTLVEIMMGVLIMTIALITMSTIFTTIAKSILVNKTKTIATNLAQEKIESLKNLSYYRLLVSTATTTDPNFSGMEYDIGTTQSYYPEETLVVGDLTFKRRTLVNFVKQSGNDFVDMTWTDPDTGIKKVTVYVVWQEGDEWKKMELRNLRSNPDRARLEFTFTGTVSSGAGNPIYNALVDTMENPSYYSRTGADGGFSFKVQPGSYTLHASATGYFTEISTAFVVFVNQTGSYTRNFTLKLMAQGNATGYAYLRDHLMITQVVADYSNTAAPVQSNQEWVELYNPSTYSVLVASRSAVGGPYDLFYVTVSWIHNSNDDPYVTGGQSRVLLGNPAMTTSKFTAFRTTSTVWDTRFSSRAAISIPPGGYFLISNFSTVAVTVGGTNITRFADAYYEGGDGGDVIDSQSGIRVTGSMGYDYNGRSDWHDGVSWGSSGANRAVERTANTNSLGADDILYRFAYKYIPSDCDDTFASGVRNAPAFRANCFDSNSNGSNCGNRADFDYNDNVTFHITTSSNIADADVTMPCYTGTPAAGATVSADDGNSAVAYVQSYGSYTVTGLSTGTWTLTISSGNYTRDISSVTITTSITTGVPNGSTQPRWDASGAPFAALTTSTIYGYISGVVRNAANQALPNATVSASGATSQNTDAQGRYRLNVVPSGYPINVTASKSGFSTEIAQDIGVGLGMTVSTVNFNLVTAGYITGFISNNGAPSGSLPGIPIVVYDPSTTTVIGSAISGSLGSVGNFLIPSVPTGTYVVAPQLESGETSSPDQVRITVTSNSTGTWVSTFTVTNAYGEIKGLVSAGSSPSQPITTGILLVASTAAITTQDPPDVTSTLRSGSQIYYSVSSDAAGRYTLPLRGNASYYLYGWYTWKPDLTTSSSTKRMAGQTYFFVGPGESVTKDISW